MILSRSKSSPIVTKRSYHVYDLASKFLTITHDELVRRKHFLKIDKNTIINKQTTIGTFMKKTKKTPHFQQLDEVEQTIDACVNIRNLCNQAYELGRRVREENLEELDIDEQNSEYLYIFICITNEYYPCYNKEDYKKIKKMFEQESL